MNEIELKQKFFNFFKEKEHSIIDFSSLVPVNDPTVLFTTAGMHPLVPFFLGQEHPLGKKLADVQICIRTTDIDEVGDKSHFTFFEMLGNWSLGSYFKKEAITYAYEFLTSEKYLNLDRNLLAITCFAGKGEISKDEVSKNYWLNLGVSEKRIEFLEDNWWGPPGESGPCGPDSEIFYWTGLKEEVPDVFDSEDERWVEIWNLVFMEFSKSKEGSFSKLKQKNVDTGMGLERVCAILNNKDDVYFYGKVNKILEFVKSLTSKTINDDNQKSFKIVVDHLRAATFILGDHSKVKPSNVDQGYVLRRFIRRAIRHANLLGINFLFTHKVANKIIELYKVEYPHIFENKDYIISNLKAEEEKFMKTLEKGVVEFNKLIEGKTKINGETAFLLYQSFGFPIELTQEMARDKNIEVDINSFYDLYKEHQKLSRASSKQKFKGGLSESSQITKKLHTVTHILNQALRNVLSEEVKQRGSNINSERLRFDFNFPRKLTPQEITNIEDEVNRVINLNLDITKEKMDLEDALKSGAQAEFGSRYPSKVWVYSIGDYSKEICMGPHVDNTKVLGTFKIVKEKSSSSGVRRIKAILE